MLGWNQEIPVLLPLNQSGKGPRMAVCVFSCPHLHTDSSLAAPPSGSPFQDSSSTKLGIPEMGHLVTVGRKATKSRGGGGACL